MTERLPFTIDHLCPETGARAGRLRTLHHEVETPIFMPVATNAAIRGIPTEAAQSLGAGILLANTYHLLLRPGPDVFKHLGGIHQMMNWPRGILTDSGGFQIFSLTKSLRITEAGAEVRSYVDGRTLLLSPEVSINTQLAIGSDIMMVLDQCIPSTSNLEQSRAALELTCRWAKRSLAARGDSPSSLFGIIQGACFRDLRRESVERTVPLCFDGYAIGGLAVGETRVEREDITEVTAALLPRDRPRYLMGVGMPIDLLEAVKRGIDMFDCILPSSLGLQGVCFSSHGRIDLTRGAYRLSNDPIDRACACSTCASYSRGYLRHLIKAGEYLGGHLIGIHNLSFYLNLMRRIRRAIVQGKFLEFYRAEKPRLILSDEENPSSPPVRRARPAMAVGAYEIHMRKEGSACIRHRGSGESMHPVADPLMEAQRLYVEQCDLIQLLNQSPRERVIWDVGLGAATNAMAAVLAYEHQTLDAPSKTLAPLRIISFENDLDSLRLALRYPSLFRHLRHQAPARLLRDGAWKSARAEVSWELQHGDFLETYQNCVAPDLIYFDPFSYKTDVTLWHHSCFQKIADHCCGHASALYTYSASTAVRAALLVSGFYVGPGWATGSKSETTVAYTLAAAQSKPLLDRKFLERWERSDARYPADLVSMEQRTLFSAAVRDHAQFSDGVFPACKTTGFLRDKS